MSTAPTLRIHYPRAGSSPANVHSLKQQISMVLLANPAFLAGPLKWEISGVSGDSRPLSRGMELVWDGVRRWPYLLWDVAESLATVVELGVLVAERPDARYDKNVAEQLVVRCLGEAIELEIVIEDDSYSRGYANRQRLRTAVRDDFHSLLNDEFRPLITDIAHILQVAFNPARVFAFDRLSSVFCTQIVPTQVVFRDERSGKARLYNLSRATRLGL